MAIITTIIPAQSFEIIRDRVGRILADELNNQFLLTGDEDLNADHWIERTLHFDKTELPSVNVNLQRGDYGGQTQTQSDGTYIYNVDVYVNSKANDSDDGDVRAGIKLHKILGKIRAIIEDPRYKTLGFATPNGFVMNRHFENIQIQNPNQRQSDTDSSLMGRLSLSVKVPETVTEITLTNIAQLDTTVKLDLTERGYLWSDVYIAPAPSPNFFDYALDFIIQ